MIDHFLLCFITLIFDVFSMCRVSPDEKDLPIAILRQQLRMLERKTKTRPRLARPEKLVLVALVTRLKGQTRCFHQCLHEAVLRVQPETLLKWHRDLVRRKWAFQQPKRGARPRLERVS
jgi:hypothetical protein